MRRFHDKAKVLIEVTEDSDIKNYVKILLYSIDKSNLEFIGFSIKNKDFFGILNNLLTENDQILGRMNTLNAHGYFKEEKDIEEFRKGLGEFNDLILKNNIELTAEVDQLFCEKCLDVYCKVIAIKKEKNLHTVVVNNSLFHSFYSVFHTKEFLSPVPMYKSKEIGECKVVGQICSGVDEISLKMTLPIPKIGDILLFENAGGKGSQYMEKTLKLICS